MPPGLGDSLPHCTLGCSGSSQSSLRYDSFVDFSASVGRVWLFSGRLPGEVVNCLMLSVLGTEDLGIVGKGCPSVALSRDQS